MLGLKAVIGSGLMLVLVTSALMLVLVTSAQAQEIGRPQRGLETAQRLCAECHAVRKGQVFSPNPNAPRFEVIAAVPGMTATALNAALQTSHRTMPNVMLDAEDLSNIVSYILSLKTGG